MQRSGPPRRFQNPITRSFSDFDWIWRILAIDFSDVAARAIMLDLDLPWFGFQRLRVSSLAPILFVLMWSTGFVVARAIVPHAAPELILTARMLLSATLLGGLAAIARKRLPRGRRLALHLLAGALLNGIYLCTSWWAIQRGMPAGIMSLLGALQPLVVAVASFGFGCGGDKAGHRNAGAVLSVAE